MLFNDFMQISPLMRSSIFFPTLNGKSLLFALPPAHIAPLSPFILRRTIDSAPNHPLPPGMGQ